MKKAKITPIFKQDRCQFDKL